MAIGGCAAPQSAYVKDVEMTMTPAPAIKAPKIGDILRCSWGYDQTNVDWYEVIAVTKASVRIRAIASKCVEDHGPTTMVVPVPGSFLDPGNGWKKDDAVYSEKGATKRFRPSGDGYAVRIESYSSAYLWDGKPAYETGANYGH